MHLRVGYSRTARLFLPLFVSFWPVAYATAQSSPAQIQAQPQPQPKINRRIGTDVVVTDKAGKPVSGLSADSFTVLDNGQPAKIISFRAVEASGAETAKPEEATQILILIDTVNSSLTTVGYQRQQVEIFLRQNGGKLSYPVSLFFFNGDGAKRLAPASRDGNALADALEKEAPNLRPIPRAQGFYGAVTRMQISVSALSSLALEEGKLPGRKILIWLSPGWPLLVHTDATTDAKEASALFGAIVSISDVLRQGRVTLHCIDPIRGAGAASLNWYHYESYLKPVTKMNNADVGNLSLQVLSRQSGGDAVGYGSDYLSGQIGAIVASSGSYYYLSFEAPLADHKDEYHALKITVNKPDLIVHTRMGYYDQP